MLKSIPKKLKTDGSISAIYGMEESGSLELPLFSARVAAGFPSPAEDHLESRLDLNQHLIRNPSSTFFVRAAGESMMEAGIYDRDLLIVDRSIEKRNRRVVIATLNGEFTVKRLVQDEEGIFLVAENPDFDSIPIQVDSDFSIWGVVTYVIHQV
jgi:DNA polymerase V